MPLIVECDLLASPHDLVQVPGYVVYRVAISQLVSLDSRQPLGSYIVDGCMRDKSSEFVDSVRRTLNRCPDEFTR